MANIVMKLPKYDAPIAYGSLTEEQFNAEIEQAMEDITMGRVYPAKEVEEEILDIINLKTRRAKNK